MRKLAAVLNGSLFGFILACILFGCASFTFPYKYFKPELKSWDGVLLGAKPSDDLPASVCAPDAQTDGKCVIMTASEFFRLKTEYLDLSQRLNTCEGH